MSNTLSPTARFSNRVQDYIKYRPHYPDGLIDWLIQASGITKDSVIADIGSGTGISAKHFLDRGYAVIGVEPNDDMRKAAEDLLSGYDRFTSVGATAENTTLPDHSVELIVAGQAFHWFDRDAFSMECKRILKSGGKVALFWNERLIDATPFLREYEDLIRKFATDYSKVDHRRMDDNVIESFFQKKPMIATFPNVQVLDFEGLKGRLMSSSYVPAPDDPVTAQMLAELRKLYNVHAVNDRIELLYETKAYLSDL
jgi:SAM-dependent methyltransferase